MSALRTAPPVERFTRRLAECPPELLSEPRTADAPAGAVDVAAVVNDLLVALGAAGGLSAKEAARLEAARAADRNALRLTLIGTWLCHDPWLREAGGLAEPVLGWLQGALPPLARLVEADLFVRDADRREELVRSLLESLGVVPEGEKPAQAADRLRALSSVDRARVIRETRAQQERARQLRERLASERARQAAARYTSE